MAPHRTIARAGLAIVGCSFVDLVEVVMVRRSSFACGSIVAAALSVAAGCGEWRSGDSRVQGALLPQNREVDLLFLVDDSASMRLTQQGLIAGFPTLMDTLGARRAGCRTSTSR